MCSVKTGGMMGAPEVGRQLRALRTASGRTVGSVAAEAGLSVPYIANLENGRGNPTVAALSQLAAALGMQLAISLVPADDEAGGGARGALRLDAGVLARPGRRRGGRRRRAARRGSAGLAGPARAHGPVPAHGAA